jgi:DNA-binding NtrC family response regulator
MSSLRKFLVVDDVPENRFLLAKTLLRKFPGAIVQECEETVTAVAAARDDRLTAVVVHRAIDSDGLSLTAAIRGANPTVPIIIVSGQESCPGAIQAGANAFLNFEAWLRIGTVVADILQAQNVNARAKTQPKLA